MPQRIEIGTDVVAAGTDDAPFIAEQLSCARAPVQRWIAARKRGHRRGLRYSVKYSRALRVDHRGPHRLEP